MEEKKIITYKGFDKNLKCRGIQYEVGKEYEMDGDIKCCERGFHACESPLEVFDHYDMLNSRFAKVEQSGEIDKEENSTKVCSSKIKVKAELKLADMINLGVEWIKELTSPTKVKKDDKLNDNGGYYAKIGSSGYSAQIGSSGDSAQIGSSGDSAKIGSSGYYAQIGSSGDSAKIGSSGDYAQIGSSGDYAQIGSSGDYAQIGSSGDYAKIESTGEHSVVMAAGHNSIVKAKIGSWITLAEWKKNDGVWVPICVKTEKVDGERIKSDTFYKLVNGEFKEVEE
nr:MAG TPA: hypothetical protein [Caudoviricetes sp.]